MSDTTKIDKKKKQTLKRRSQRTKEKREKIKDTLTIDGLEELIREVIEEMELLTNVNAMHDENGRFSTKSRAKVYSLTKNNKFKNSDLEVPARGDITKNGKISSRYGANSGSPETQCGRLTIDGKPKKKTRRCYDYRKGNTYSSQNEQQEEENSVMSSADTLYLKALIKKEFEHLKKEFLATQHQQRASTKKKEGGGCTWQNFLRLNQQYIASQEPPKK